MRRMSGGPACRQIAAACRDERAQATVEMAVVAPVLIVLALIVYNLMVFVAATARFDRVAPDIVLACGVAPSGEGEEGSAGDAAEVRERLEEAMAGYELEIEVGVSEGEGGANDDSLLALAGALMTYTCTMSYRPWPSGFSVAGVEMGAPARLRHERAVTIDPWRPGVVL